MSDIITDLKDHILTITMNRPAKKNALTVAMYAAMADALEQAEADLSVRVVLLQGTDGVFTAGNDLNDFLANPPRDEDAPVLRFLLALARATVPIIAAVDGPAVGIGTTMLLHADLVIAADTTIFCLPFTSLALVPEGGSTYLLPKTIGKARTHELLLSGRRFTADEALLYGLITEVCASDALVSTSASHAAMFAAKPPASMRKSKSLLKTDMEDVIDRIRLEISEFGPALASPEAKEAFTAFMEKRKPDFSKF